MYTCTKHVRSSLQLLLFAFVQCIYNSIPNSSVNVNRLLLFIVNIWSRINRVLDHHPSRLRPTCVILLSLLLFTVSFASVKHEEEQQRKKNRDCRTAWKSIDNSNGTHRLNNNDERWWWCEHRARIIRLFHVQSRQF